MLQLNAASGGAAHRQKHDGSTGSQFQFQQSPAHVCIGELPPREHGGQGKVAIAVSDFLRRDQQQVC